MGTKAVPGLAWRGDGSLLVTQGITLRQVVRLTREEVLAARKK